MRSVPKGAALILVFGIIAGCSDSRVAPTEVEPAFLLDGSSETPLIGDDIVNLERPVIDLAGWDDERTIVPLEVLTPEAASNIGTGSAIVITIPDEGRFGCTANFIWQARATWQRYLGSAGHCFLPGDATSTHGPGADYDASGVVVEVCVEDCVANFQANLLVGTWVTLGEVAYARQASAEGQAVGFDFGVVEVPRVLNDLVRPAMPVWGGPTGTHELQLGDIACHYGHGLGFGKTFLTKARSGIAGQSNEESWAGDFAAAFGDSGSGLVACEPSGATLKGEGAAGVLTHLGVRLNPVTGEHGVVLGTTTAQSVRLAREARLRLTLVLE